MLSKQLLDLLQIAELEGVHEFALACRHTGSAGQAPVQPAVVATAQDLLPARVRARDADGSGRGRRAAEHEPHHLRKRDNPDQPLRRLDDQRMLGGVDGAVGELPRDGLVHPRVGVAQHDGTVAHQVVEVLVAIHIPEARALRPRGEGGHSVLEQVLKALVALTTTHDHLQGAAPQLSTASDAVNALGHGRGLLAVCLVLQRDLHNETCVAAAWEGPPTPASAPNSRCSIRLPLARGRAAYAGGTSIRDGGWT